MNKITCDICMDLMPLVQDNVASEDSVNAVKQHLETCPECRAMFEGEIPSHSDKNEIIKKVQRKIHTFLIMVLMFGTFFGLSLTATSEQFLNVLIMPILGGIGYFVFRWKSLYITPGLLIITHLVINALSLLNQAAYMEIATELMWAVVCSVFAVIGTVIVGLLHFAFQKEK